MVWCCNLQSKDWFDPSLVNSVLIFYFPMAVHTYTFHYLLNISVSQSTSTSLPSAICCWLWKATMTQDMSYYLVSYISLYSLSSYTWFSTSLLVTLSISLIFIRLHFEYFCYQFSSLSTVYVSHPYETILFAYIFITWFLLYAAS